MQMLLKTMAILVKSRRWRTLAEVRFITLLCSLNPQIAVLIVKHKEAIKTGTLQTQTPSLTGEGNDSSKDKCWTLWCRYGQYKLIFIGGPVIYLLNFEILNTVFVVASKFRYFPTVFQKHNNF